MTRNIVFELGNKMNNAGGYYTHQLISSLKFTHYL